MGSLNHELQFLQGNRFSEDLETSQSHAALRKERQISRKILIFASTVAVTGIVCLVIGIALLRMNARAQGDEAFSANRKPDETRNGIENGDRSIDATTSKNFTEICSYSSEFKKSGMKRYKSSYYSFINRLL